MPGANAVKVAVPPTWTVVSLGSMVGGMIGAVKSYGHGAANENAAAFDAAAAAADDADEA